MSMTNSNNTNWDRTSDRHQEFLTEHTAMVYVIAVCAVKNPSDGQRNSPKHVEFNSKNKFQKLVHLVGFIIRILSCRFYSYLLILPQNSSTNTFTTVTGDNRDIIYNRL